MKEIAVISGKGGTGKSSFVLSLLPYLKKCVIADCDVDAPDLKVLLGEDITDTIDFYAFEIPVFNDDLCIKCGKCVRHCNFNAITEDIKLKDGACEGCKVCEYVCPTGAITMVKHQNGHLYTRNTIYGPMVDAKLYPGEESSGKLVSAVRTKSQEVAKTHTLDNIIIDGSPGVACNVISTITGVDKVYIVTEPSVSGLHDLKRVIDLIHIFNTEVEVVINKSGINSNQEQKIVNYCASLHLNIALKIPFTRDIPEAIARLEIPSLSDIDFFKSNDWEAFIDGFRDYLN